IVAYQCCIYIVNSKRYQTNAVVGRLFVICGIRDMCVNVIQLVSQRVENCAVAVYPVIISSCARSKFNPCFFCDGIGGKQCDLVLEDPDDIKPLLDRGDRRRTIELICTWYNAIICRLKRYM